MVRMRNSIVLRLFYIVQDNPCIFGTRESAVLEIEFTANERS